MVRGDPGQRRRAQLRGVAHQFVHQPHLVRLARAKQFAFDEKRLRAQQPQQTRHLRHAGRAGQQPERHFGQAELDLRVVHRNAVVPHQRQLPAATQRGAVQAAHDRLAQCFERAEVLLDEFDAGERRPAVAGLEAHHAFQVGAGEEGRLGRRQHDALNAFAIRDHLRHRLRQVGLPGLAHRVDGRAEFVERQRRNAVVERIGNRRHRHRVRPAQQSWRCPCRPPRTRWPGRSATCAGAVRRPGC